MEPAKSFNNVIIGQFVLTRVPVKVYVDGRYLTMTDADDVEDPTFGFGMDEDGAMQRFDYRNVTQLLVSGNVVDLEIYNKGMEAKFGDGGEEKAEEPKDDKKADEEDEEGDEEGDEENPFKDHYMPSMDEGHEYTFGTGDIIKNINPKCKHYGSMGIIDKVMDIPDYIGKVAIYRVTNSGDTYSPGDVLTKTVDQLAPIQAPDDLDTDEI